MKNVTVTSAQLKREGVDGVALGTRSLQLDRQETLTEAEYEKFQEALPAWEEQFGVTVEVANEGEPGGAPTDGTAKGRTR